MSRERMSSAEQCWRGAPPARCDGRVTPRSLLDPGAEHLFHEPQAEPAVRIAGPVGIAPTVGPDRVRMPGEGDQALVIPVLIAVVDGLAGEHSRAVVLVGALGRDPYVVVPRGPAIVRS